uniref:CSON007289 protein n=1 Tax=Culicoides sonorensis TaxID=179676 RepID=A0A336LXL8_CULSO
MANLVNSSRSMSPAVSGHSVIAVQKYQGLSLEPNNNNKLAEIGSEQSLAEAVTKEEEIITKRKTELTTTKQIETRVKRQVKLEDGKVIEDSGPIIETNTTEDTDKQESETVERKNLGQPEDNKPLKSIDLIDSGSKGLVRKNSNDVTETKLVPRPKDGLVREITDNIKISREERNERVETEDVHHLGDFSDEVCSFLIIFLP